MSADSGVSIAASPLRLGFNITEQEIRDFGKIDQILDDYLKKERMFDVVTEALVIVFYAVFMISGILANLCVILVIMFNKKLKTSNHILLVNLFVSDLLLCLFCMPFTLLAIIRRSWYFGQYMCKLIPFIQAVAIFVSAATITSIAVDRMWQITANKIIGAKTRVPGRQVRYGLNTCLIWIISVALAAPIAFYQDVVEFGIKGLVTYDKCLEDWPQNYKTVYSIVILVAQLLIPNAVMLYSHYRIRRHLDVNRFTSHKGSVIETSKTSSYRRTDREVAITEDLPTSSTSATAPTFTAKQMTTHYDFKHFHREVRRNNRITIFLVTITIMFSISWLPWNLFNVSADFATDIDLPPRDLYLILAVCHLIAMTSATTNAIFYGFLHTTIRTEISKWIVPKCLR